MLKCLSVYPYNIVYLYMSCTRQIFLFVWFCHFMHLPGQIFTYEQVTNHVAIHLSAPTAHL